MPKPVLLHDVYWSLRQQIIEWKLVPGQVLPETRLAAEFHVSRTPLREALRKLAEDGLVDYEPHRRARVAALTAADVYDVFLVREALEGVAAREAANKLKPAVLKSFREHYEGLRSHVAAGRLTDVGDGIHQLIFRAVGGECLRKSMDVVMGQVRRVQYVAGLSPTRLRHSYREHEAILNCLELRDAVAAEAAARSHVRSVLAHITEVIEYGAGSAARIAR